MKNLLISFFIIFPLTALSQNRNSIWCFGDSAGIDFRIPGSPVLFTSIIRSKGDCSSVADENGNLLFYVGGDSTLTSLGGKIYNRNHEQMPFGWGLRTGNWHHEMIIIPLPGDPDKYYIFHTSVTIDFGIYYSIIDMSLDNGNGDVAQANIRITTESVTDGVGAVRHANGRDWWLIYAMAHLGAGSANNEFYMYLISPEGISSPYILNMGELFHTNGGDISFSEDGSKMLFSAITGLIEVFDFDRCSGTFSNPVIVELDSPSTRAIASCALSPDKNLVYVSSNDYTSYIYQYDLRANPVSSSRDTLATFSDMHNISGMLRLAPDNKIYLSNIYNNFVQNYFPYDDSIYNPYNMNLSVINSPDSAGSACNFQPYSFYLGGKRTYFGLPNNPNYELGPMPGSVCDSLISVPEFQTSEIMLTIYPNPYCNKISFHPVSFIEKEVVIEITNETGQLLLSRKIPFKDQEIDLSDLPKGAFSMRVTGNRFSVVKQLIHL